MRNPLNELVSMLQMASAISDALQMSTRQIHPGSHRNQGEWLVSVNSS